MRGRTNVGGGGTAEIYADTELFTVAEGSNVTAGNFVQYKLERNERKYDTNIGCSYSFYKSQNEAPKVLPCGNGKYIRRYKNNNETNVYWFNIIDTNEGFNVLSSISIKNDYIPSFCLLNDGNIAICYMEKNNSFVVRIYEIENYFNQLGVYEFSNEMVGDIGWTHITQLKNTKIVLTNKNNYCICNYISGVVEEDFYGNFEISYEIGRYSLVPSCVGDNDWNLYTIENDKFLLFPFLDYYDSINETYNVIYFVNLYKVENKNLELISSVEYSKYSGNIRYGSKEDYQVNRCIWGNAFETNGKVLFSDGKKNDNSYIDCYETMIFYTLFDNIMQSKKINIFEIVKNEFPGFYNEIFNKELSSLSSGTVQFVSDNIFYVAVLPQNIYRVSNDEFLYLNPNNKTAIVRMEYEPNSGEFKKSNIVTFEIEDKDARYFLGYGQFFANESGDVYYLYETGFDLTNEKSGRWIMKLSYKNGILSIGESTGLVENYNASGAAIGVAKQSGSAGQQVEVYVPKV